MSGTSLLGQTNDVVMVLKEEGKDKGGFVLLM